VISVKEQSKYVLFENSKLDTKNMLDQLEFGSGQILFVFCVLLHHSIIIVYLRKLLFTRFAVVARYISCDSCLFEKCPPDGHISQSFAVCSYATSSDTDRWTKCPYFLL